MRSAAGRAAATGLGLDTLGLDDAGRLARQCDVAVDATGDPAGFATASTLVRPCGTLVLKSTIHGQTPVAFSPLVVDEITVVGSRCGPFAQAIGLLAAGRVNVAPLLADIYPFERFAEAFDRARSGLKVILKPVL